VAQTFGDVTRTVRLYAPAAPPFLVRAWVNKVYKDLARARHWNFLRKDLRLTINASRAVALVSVTNGSPIVTSAALFVAADVGRQITFANPLSVISGNFPIYTIISEQSTSQITLDIPYGEPTTALAGATVLDAYFTAPADFESFRIIADPYNERRLAFWITPDQLNILDPTRQASDTGPRCLVEAAPSTYPATLGQMRYEYWPRPTAQRSYPAYYNVQAASIGDTTTFSGVLGDGADVLIEGCLAQAALWPGTPDRPNPYFNAPLAKTKAGEYALGLQRLALRDDEQHPDDLATVHWERWPLADLAYNDQALRATDATIADLY
jgi:hypothetical protein